MCQPGRHSLLANPPTPSTPDAFSHSHPQSQARAPRRVHRAWQPFERPRSRPHRPARFRPASHNIPPAPRAIAQTPPLLSLALGSLARTYCPIQQYSHRQMEDNPRDSSLQQPAFRRKTRGWNPPGNWTDGRADTRHDSDKTDSTPGEGYGARRLFASWTLHPVVRMSCSTPHLAGKPPIPLVNFSSKQISPLCQPPPTHFH